jgi:hypothetical protein
MSSSRNASSCGRAKLSTETTQDRMQGRMLVNVVTSIRKVQNAHLMSRVDNSLPPALGQGQVKKEN